MSSSLLRTERGLCDPGNQEYAVCPYRDLGGACYSVYTDTPGGGNRAKGNRGRGEKADAGKAGLSKAAPAHLIFQVY